MLSEGAVLNGMHAHEDIFTTLAVAPGIDDPVMRVREEMNQCIDGVNYLPYCLGEQDASVRTHIFQHYESQLMAVRVGPWKLHLINDRGLLSPDPAAKHAAYVQSTDRPLRELR